MRFLPCVAIVCIVFIICVANLAFAVDATSPNFQNFDSSFVPTTFNQASTNYQVNGSIEPIVQASVSPNFGIQHGVPLVDPPAPTPTPTPTPQPLGGGGGGGVYTPPAATTTPPAVFVPPPTLNFKSPTFFSHRLIYGTRDVSIKTILVNGSSAGVKITAPISWERDMPVFLGYNDLYVQAQDSAGNKSATVYGRLKRMLIGDVNDNRKVDDTDLSLFTRAWHKYTFFADFNEDNVIDDLDLSLLASHWLRFY